jgi:S-(hydroxymethyl)glutathione dehydrogenase/alcohol dehydrogenase
MRAAVLHSIDDGKIVISDDVVAVGPGPGQVRIRVRAAGVCHSDLSARNGGLPQPVPAILGHEAAGDVIEVGDGVTGLAAGDRVIVNWLPPCGNCASCVRGEPHLCMTHVIAAYLEPRFLVGGTPAFGMAGCGAFAEEMVVPQEGAVKIPPDVPYEVAALVGCGVMTGVGAVINTARVEPGASVAVIGCGGVGIAAIQGARLSGAAVIAGVDPVESKHEAARRFGATHAVRPDELGALSAEVTGGEGFDYVFEVVGTPQTIRATPFELLFDGKVMLGSIYGAADVRRDYLRLLSLWRAGRLDLEGMITQRLKLDDVDHALGALGRGDVIRQVIIHD